ncbi:hypothetical protein TNCT_236121 [Trichonephila clavata]|uniref:Uncharacterized protein n=1 Tax=Trichonephila clavata TaxID=2740835 RepID=A0A8X6I160_TRICU|nr:hypothetical protein TNCT_236121 [Trichonephila clavata]
MSSESSPESPVRRRRRRRRPARQRTSPNTSFDMSAYIDQEFNERIAAAEAAPQTPPRRMINEGITSPRMRMFEEFQRHIEESGEWLMGLTHQRMELAYDHIPAGKCSPTHDTQDALSTRLRCCLVLPFLSILSPIDYFW